MKIKKNSKTVMYYANTGIVDSIEKTTFENDRNEYAIACCSKTGKASYNGLEVNLSNLSFELLKELCKNTRTSIKLENISCIYDYINEISSEIAKAEYLSYLSCIELELAMELELTGEPEFTGEAVLKKSLSQEEYCNAKKIHEIRLSHFEINENYIRLKFRDEDVAVFPK